MRIISPKKDYYDCIQSVSQDRSIQYIREPKDEQIEKSKWPFPDSPWNFFSGIGYEWNSYIIGFCGKIYPAVKIWQSRPADSSAEKMCFSVDEIQTFIETHVKKKFQKTFHNGTKYSYGTKKSFDKFFQECDKKCNDYLEMFISRRCPVFVAQQRTYHDQVISYNILLKDFEFYRVFDAYTAFQEIFMFMNNLAVPQKNIPTISDEMKAQAHGYDKWSFRKPPYSI